MPSATAPAAATGLPNTFSVSLPNDLPLDQMAQLYDALRTVKDVVAGLCCRPRFRASHGHYNSAGEFLDALGELIGHATDQLAEAAEATRPDEASDDFADRASILMLHDFHTEGITTAADRAIELYASAGGANECP